MNKEQQNRWKSLINRLNIKYRLVILDDATLEEKISFKLTRMNTYLVLSTLFVFCVMLTVFTIVSTPLKQYIPGYQDVSLRRDLLDLNQQSDSLNLLVASQARYIDAFRKMFTSNVNDQSITTPTETGENDSLINDYSDIDLDKITEQEEQVRSAVEREMEYTLSGSKDKQDQLHKNFFVRPIDGILVRGFEPEIEHYGLDIGSNQETPQVLAIADGIVIMDTWTLDTGYVVGIQHDNNLISFYKHNAVILKKIGNFVKAGDVIAILGNTGELTSGPHLHFELWHNQLPVDPLNYISL